MRPLELVLASASPRRLELLRALGLEPHARPAHVDESVRSGESGDRYVERLARAKTAAVVEALRAEGARAFVLAADTAVVLDGAILGKPADRDDALAMLRRLSGRTHDVVTSVRLVATHDPETAETTVSTRVRFRGCPDSLLAWYVATGEPFDKAGAYGIQGYGVFLTNGIDGSWSNVVGLPLEPLPELFEAVGVDLFASIPRR